MNPKTRDKRRITNIYLLTFSFSSSFPLNRNKKEEEEKVKEKVKGDPKDMRKKETLENMAGRFSSLRF